MVNDDVVGGETLEMKTEQRWVCGSEKLKEREFNDGQNGEGDTRWRREREMVLVQDSGGGNDGGDGGVVQKRVDHLRLVFVCQGSIYLSLSLSLYIFHLM